MSLVENITFENRNARRQEPARTTYSVLHDGEETLVQLQSYGRAGRANRGSASQTLQFTKESAQQLVEVLQREFRLQL